MSAKFPRGGAGPFFSLKSIGTGVNCIHHQGRLDYAPVTPGAKKLGFGPDSIRTLVSMA